MKRTIIALAVLSALCHGGGTRYTIDADDMSSLMLCIASLSDLALKSNASTCIMGVKVCGYDGWDESEGEKACKELSDFCEGFSKPIREVSDECAGLTDRIVQKLRREGQLPSTGRMTSD